jgi:serine/threonine-protein kinase
MAAPETLDPAAMLGRVVGGKYVLEALLGAGGMGAVFRARHQDLATTAAVKLLLSEDAEHTARFEREASALARIDHRSVVRVLDFGRDEGGFLYLAMEHVSGIDLQRLVATQGALPLERVVALGADVLAGLAAAHGAGILHRDLKPSNVLLTRVTDDDGRTRETAKLCDFGIATAMQGSRTVGTNGPLTRTGYVVGTPEYMAPEQALGKEIDVRTDLYAVGVLLFELATASRPFGGATPVEVAVQHVSGPIPRPSSLALLPEAFDALCIRAMSKDAGSRFEDARAMRRALLDVLRGVDAHATSATIATPHLDDVRRSAATARSDAAVTLAASGADGDEGLVGASRAQRKLAWGAAGAAVVALALGASWLVADDPPAPRPAAPPRVTIAASGAQAAPSAAAAPRARAAERPTAPVVALAEATVAPPPKGRAIVVRSSDPVEPAAGGTAVPAASPKSGPLAPGGDPRAGVAAATLPNSAPTVADAVQELRRALGSVTRVQAGPGLAESDIGAQGERARRSLEQCAMRSATGLHRGDLGELVARFQVSPDGKVQGVQFDDARWPEAVRACAQRAIVGLYLPHALPSATTAVLGLGLVLD